MDYKIRYPKFLKKAVTLSYDDGTFYDVFLVKMLKKFGMKCTFNINSGLFGATTQIDFGATEESRKRFGDTIVFHNRLSEEQTGMLYRGHEVAAHSLTHPLLINQPKEFLDREVLEDVKNLTRICGEQVVGFAYPGGPHDEFTDSYLSDKVLYARGIADTLSFELPEKFVPLEPTVFHMSEHFVPLAEQYAKLNPDEITWFYIWGHSYEFALPHTTENFVKVCELLSAQKDIWFATNKEIISYVNCARKLRCENGKLVNPTDCDVYAEYRGKNVVVPKNSSL